MDKFLWLLSITIANDDSDYLTNHQSYELKASFAFSQSFYHFITPSFIPFKNLLPKLPLEILFSNPMRNPLFRKPLSDIFVKYQIKKMKMNMKIFNIKKSTYVITPITESFEHGSHITTTFHRNNTDMILLINPHQQVLVVVVPYTTSFGPVTGHTGRCKQRWDGFVEQEVVGDEGVLFCLRHGGEWVVFSWNEDDKISENC